MNYNNSANRQRFEREQRRLAKQYEALGMSDEVIQIMYEYDLSVFNSNRRFIEHMATVEEMTAYDHSTGESHYKDMDEFPAQTEQIHYSLIGAKWLEDIEDQNLFMALTAMPANYITIISMKMDGYSDTEISQIVGCDNSTVTHKVSRIRKIIKKVYQ